MRDFLGLARGAAVRPDGFDSLGPGFQSGNWFISTSERWRSLDQCFGLYFSHRCRAIARLYHPDPVCHQSRFRRECCSSCRENGLSFLCTFARPSQLCFVLHTFLASSSTRNVGETGWRLDPHSLRGSVNYDGDRCRHRALAVSRNPGLASSLFVIRDVLWSILSMPQNNNLAQLLLTTEEELSMTRLGSLVLIFAAGSILVFFPILAVLQALVVDRLRIRAK